ncbi:histidinol-phosphate aminotransferase family protein [bacterium]|nr:histidinol-phosphate aminotransferase family protein [bacterium]
MSGTPVYQWQPTTADIARMAGIDPADVVRFDHNTSPYAPPWSRDALLAAAGGLNEYPGADYRPLREALAQRHGVEPEWIVPGAGADELILMIAKAFLDPGDLAVSDSPAYPMYRIATLQRGASYTGIPRSEIGFPFPTEALASAAAKADLTWLCVPHNPIGDRPADAAIEAVVEASHLTVIDAAYGEFAGDSWTGLIEAHPDLLVLGTMSKAYGLASIRVGYAIAHPDRIARLDAVRPPGSVSTVSAALALRGLGDPDWMASNVARITAGRNDLAATLLDVGFDPWPSVTNFIVTPVGPEARVLARRIMEREGLVIRSFPEGHALEQHLRFTARTGADHTRLADALRRHR